MNWLYKDIEYMELLGERAKAHRLKLNITQKEMGEILAFSKIKNLPIFGSKSHPEKIQFEHSFPKDEKLSGKKQIIFSNKILLKSFTFKLTTQRRKEFILPNMRHFIKNIN